MSSKLSSYNYILCSAFARVVDTLVKQGCIISGEYRVCYIANAADFDKEGDVWPGWVTEDMEALQKLGYILDIVDLRTENRESLTQNLLSADAVFVGGGNTFWLLQCMITSGFRDIIKEHIGKGLLYISTSAGSCVCSQDITYAKFVDNPTLAKNTDYVGLGFLPIAINPHFNGDEMPEGDSQTFEFIYKSNYNPIVCLKDTQAIVGYIDGLYKFIV